MTTPIECDLCHEIFDLEFDATRIVMLRESGRVQLEDAEWEQAANRDFGACPECDERTPAGFLVGLMADAIEEKGIDWLESELKYQAGAGSAPGRGRSTLGDSAPPLRAGGPSSGSCASDGGEPVHLPVLEWGKGGSCRHSDAAPGKERPCPTPEAA